MRRARPSICAIACSATARALAPPLLVTTTPLFLAAKRSIWSTPTPNGETTFRFGKKVISLSPNFIFETTTPNTFWRSKGNGLEKLRHDICKKPFCAIFFLRSVELTVFEKESLALRIIFFFLFAIFFIDLLKRKPPQDQGQNESFYSSRGVNVVGRPPSIGRPYSSSIRTRSSNTGVDGSKIMQSITASS